MGCVEFFRGDVLVSDAFESVQGGSISYFADTVFNYPTLAEAYKVAALNGLKRVGNQNVAAEEFDAPQGQQSPAEEPVATE